MRCFLQIAILIGGCVPVSAGLASILLSVSLFGDDFFSIDLDSHYRYLSGLLLGIGIAFWSTIPSVEYKTERFQLLTFVVFVGGLARLLSLIEYGVPSKPMVFGLIMELAVTPILYFLQSKIAERSPRKIL